MVINTNIAALSSAENLNNSTNMLNQSLARLSSGSKIVNASDDPAGLAESVSLNAQIGQTNAANGNVGNALSFSQTQDGYLQQVGSALDQMASLAVQAQDVTKSSAELTDYQASSMPWLDSSRMRLPNSSMVSRCSVLRLFPSRPTAMARNSA